MLRNAVFFLLHWIVLIFRVTPAGALRVLGTTTLGSDPPTVNRLNGESFQQDALVSFNGFQYAVLWTVAPSNISVRHATVSRRPLQSDHWESLTLTDYDQTEDDGHDMWAFFNFNCPLEQIRQNFSGIIPRRRHPPSHIRPARQSA